MGVALQINLLKAPTSTGGVATKGSLQRLGAYKPLAFPFLPAADDQRKSAGPNWAGTRSRSPAHRPRLRGLSTCR